MYCMLQRSISTLLLYQIGVNNELLLQQWLQSCTTIWNHFYSLSVVNNKKIIYLITGFFLSLPQSEIQICSFIPPPQCTLLNISEAASVHIAHTDTVKIQWVSILPPTALHLLSWVVSFFVNSTHFSTYSTSGLTLSWPFYIVLHFLLLTES